MENPQHWDRHGAGVRLPHFCHILTGTGGGRIVVRRDDTPPSNPAKIGPSAANAVPEIQSQKARVMPNKSVSDEPRANP